MVASNKHTTSRINIQVGWMVSLLPSILYTVGTVVT